MSDEHDELRARLRAADPASSLARPDPDRVARLLEDTMSHPETQESRDHGTRQRSPLTWLVAAAAFVIIAGVGVFAVMNRDTGTPSAGPEQSPSTSGDSVTELQAPGAGATTGRCLPPSADVLAEPTSPSTAPSRGYGVTSSRSRPPAGTPASRPTW